MMSDMDSILPPADVFGGLDDAEDLGLGRSRLREEAAKLAAQWDRLFETHGVINFVGAPATGKTTAARSYSAGRSRPSAWLTLTDGDRSAHRLVQSLTESLEEYQPGVSSTVQDWLQRHSDPVHAAASLAESLSGPPVLLIIDEGHIAGEHPEALATLAAFLHRAPAVVRILLCSDRPLPWPHPGGPRYRAHGHTTSNRLAPLVREKLAEQLASAGAPATSWHAASLLSPTPLPALEALLAAVGPDFRNALLMSCLWSVADEKVAQALGMVGPWRRLCRMRLPFVWQDPTGYTVHPQIRLAARARLAAEPAIASVAYCARLDDLRARGGFEDAVELELCRCRWDQAFELSIDALPVVVRRRDWRTVHRWAVAFGAERIHRHPRWVAAWIRACYGLGTPGEAGTVIVTAEQRGTLRLAVAADPELPAAMAWTTYAQPTQLRRIVEEYQRDEPHAEAVRFYLDAVYSTEVAVFTGPYFPAEVERHLAWGLFLQGRLKELALLIPEEGPVHDATFVLGLAFAGRVDAARDVWERMPAGVKDSVHGRFVRGAISSVAGDREEAAEFLRAAAHDEAWATNPVVAAYRSFWGYITLLEQGAAAAIAWLEPLMETLNGHGLRAYAELAGCFLGLAYLRANRPEEALTLLAECSKSMSESGRLLVLPMAETGLSEARALVGDALGASTSADRALAVAEDADSPWVLLQAVRAFPKVLHREIRRGNAKPRWQRLTTSPTSTVSAGIGWRSWAAPTPRGLQLRPFGVDAALWVGGLPVASRRQKVLEFVLLMSEHPRGVEREAVLSTLFEQADPRRAGNHLRQILFHFQQQTGLVVERVGTRLAWPADVGLSSQHLEFQSLVRQANMHLGEDRQDFLERSLRLAEGTILPASTLAWVGRLRNHVELVKEEAFLELASCHLELQRPDAARTVCEQVLAGNPFADAAYRLLFTIERLIGSESSAIAVHRRATLALGELGLSPGQVRLLLMSA
jgi:DNA-binding SARP family transcriptional activator